MSGTQKVVIAVVVFIGILSFVLSLTSDNKQKKLCEESGGTYFTAYLGGSCTILPTK